MYYSADYDQLPLEDFFLPFGGSLDPKNRWVKLSRIMPWEKIEEIYLRTMSVETGRRAYSSRIAFGSIYGRRLPQKVRFLPGGGAGG